MGDLQESQMKLPVEQGRGWKDREKVEGRTGVVEEVVVVGVGVGV